MEKIMDNNLQIRNSAVEFLNYTFDDAFKFLNIEKYRKEIL